MKKYLIITTIFVFIYSNVSFAKVVKEYFPDGRVYTIQNYAENGEIIGPYRIFWQNGRLRQKIFYKNGQPYLVKRWSIDGVRLP